MSVSKLSAQNVDLRKIVSDMEAGGLKVFSWYPQNPQEMVEIPLKIIFENQPDLLLKMSKVRQIKILIHGFRDTGTTTWVLSFKNNYLRSNSFNETAIFSLDWRKLAGTNAISYVMAAYRTRQVGYNFGHWLTKYLQQNSIDLSLIHIIGFSLGCHVAGFTGDAMKGKVGRITGLDPAGLMFGRYTRRLSKDSAKFVDVLHTTAGSFVSIGDPIGHADFFANGGRAPQPGCEKDTTIDHKCSHYRAYMLFGETILQPYLFPARKCESYDKYLRQNCNEVGNGESALMGENVSQLARGSFFFVTSSQSPFILLSTSGVAEKPVSEKVTVIDRLTASLGNLIG